MQPPLSPAQRIKQERNSRHAAAEELPGSISSPVAKNPERSAESPPPDAVASYPAQLSVFVGTWNLAGGVSRAHVGSGESR